MDQQPPSSRALGDLARAAGDVLVELRGGHDLLVGSLAYDSRTAEPGALFFCVPGMMSDGHDHAATAASRGAVAVVAERPTEVRVPHVFVRDARRALARVAAEWFGHPSRDLLMVGVTGTNGKTTTVFLIDAILRAAGHTTGLIGTIETRIGRERRAGVRTTPDSLDLQRLLAEMRAASVTAVAMEVTSHALVLHRVDTITYASAAFTNLTQDHLDFHRDMEDYFAAKRSLFTRERASAGASNLDDPSGRRLYEEAAIPTIGYGVAPDAEVRAENVGIGPTGTRFRMRTPRGDADIETSLIGAFNVSNCLAAAAACLQAGISLDAIHAGLHGLDAVPGRFESVDEGQPFSVVVDYAHTPDSLDNVLREARRIAETRQPPARVVCAFGCGGDRDAAKRPLMGAVVARLADVVIVTSDNPRSEEPKAIIDEVLEGVIAHRPDGPDLVLEDRREAIERALGAAEPGDVVVIAGKGHETGQEFADRTIPFDDRLVARDVLRRLEHRR